MALSRSQRRFKQLFLVDIENNAADMARGAGLVPDQTTAGANPLSGFFPCANPERNVEMAAGLGNFPDCLVRALAILRFEQGKKQLVGNGLFAGDAEKASRLHFSGEPAAHPRMRRLACHAFTVAGLLCSTAVRRSDNSASAPLIAL